MRIGTSTRVVWHLPTTAAIDFIAEAGFEHIELWTEYPNLCLDLIENGDVTRIQQSIRSHGLHVSVHAPIRDINLSSSNYGIRNESVRQVKDAIHFASKIEAPIVVIHPGKQTSRKDPLDWIEAVLQESLREIVTFAEQVDVTLAMENMESRKGEYVTTAEKVVSIIEKAGSSHLRATFDVAHAHTVSRDLIAFYETLKQYVIHVHLSDNTGPGANTHATIGQGNVDFLGTLACMHESGYQGALVVEGYDPRDPEGATLRNFAKLQEIVSAALQ